MRSKFVVIADVGGEDSRQVRLAEDEDVIEAFPADRADQSFRLPILPGRPRGGRVIAYTEHGQYRRIPRYLGRVIDAFKGPRAVDAGWSGWHERVVKLPEDSTGA